MDAVVDVQNLVLVVDDDSGIREAVADLLRAEGVGTRCFASTEELLDGQMTQADCILLDVQMPGLSGLDLQQCLNDAGSPMPVIFMTGQRDIETCVQAMKHGARDFLVKPFSDEDLMAAVRLALEAASDRRGRQVERERVLALRHTLTPREYEVMLKVVEGLMNKQIAHQLGVAEITVKLHRGKVMRKMEAMSVADLVRMTAILDG